MDQLEIDSAIGTKPRELRKFDFDVLNEIEPSKYPGGIDVQE